MCRSQQVFYIAVKVAAFICLVLGIVQFAYAVQAFKVATNTPWGAWWAGVSLILFAVFSFFSKSKGCCNIGTAMGFGIPAVILLLAGAILDGFSYAFVEEIEACANTDGHTYGNNNYAAAALGCVVSNRDYDCSCVQDNIHTTDDDGVTCYLFDMAGSSISCQPILDLPPPLHGSYSACIAGMLVASVLAIMTCTAVCCPHYAMSEEEAAAMTSSAQLTQSINSTAQSNPIVLEAQQQQQPGVVVAVATQY